MGPVSANSKMRELLLRAKVVDEHQLRAALVRVERYGGRLPSVLVDMGLISEDHLTQLLAAALRLPAQPLRTIARDADALARLDARFCGEHAVFPVSLNQRTHTLVLAMADPTALDVVDLVAAKVNARVQTVVASEGSIRAAIERHYFGLRPAPGELDPSRGAGGLKPDEADEDEVPAAEPFELDHSAPPPTSRASPEVMARRPSANTLLDEMLGDHAPPAELTEEQLARLGSLRRTQEKTSTILSALRALLIEKGFLRP